MEETKQNVAKLARWQKIEIGVFSVLALCIVVDIIQRVNSNKQCETAITVEGLRRQNAQLLKNNEMLLSTVKSLDVAIGERNERDSLRQVRIAANDEKLANTINRRLTEIDRNYEKTQAAIRNFNAADVGGYIANEARRLRNVQQNRGLEDTNRKQ